MEESANEPIPYNPIVTEPETRNPEASQSQIVTSEGSPPKLVEAEEIPSKAAELVSESEDRPTKSCRNRGWSFKAH